MNKSSSLTAIALTGVTALAIAVPSIAPRISDALEPATNARPTITAPTVPRTTVPTATTQAASTSTVTDAQSRGVVLIDTQSASGEAAGTGMVLTASGQVLTNYHVVRDSTAIEVTIADTGTTYTATVLGHDASKDVALLQLKDASGLATVTPDDDALGVGEQLTAVGNANGGDRLVAASGSVTALNQQLTASEGDSSETLTGMVQTNAQAVPGDSGGPMFDAEGEVSAMTTAGSQAVTRSRGRATQGQVVTTESYGVPIATALQVVDQIRSGQETATVQVGAKPYLGVAVGSSSLVVSSVVDGSPAADAGLTERSNITSINGTAVTTHDELSAALATLDPGQKVTVTWSDAEGVRHSAKVTLGKSPVN